MYSITLFIIIANVCACDMLLVHVQLYLLQVCTVIEKKQQYCYLCGVRDQQLLLALTRYANKTASLTILRRTQRKDSLITVSMSDKEGIRERGRQADRETEMVEGREEFVRKQTYVHIHVYMYMHMHNNYKQKVTHSHFYTLYFFLSVC